GISLGTEFSWWRMQDPRYYDLIFNNYDTLILSEFSWKGFWRGRGDYDFESLDRIVDWAVRHGFRVRASHLVWGATEESSDVLPDWLRQGKYSRDEYIQILNEHVITVVSHFKGRVTEWSIANEAVSRSAWKGADFWMDKIGPEYIELSFRWAREADPDAILIFNDNNNESPRDAETRRVTTKMYDTIKGLREKGVPIDVVGMQMHLLLKYSSQIPPKKQDVFDTMRKFGKLGVKIYITEFDVDVHKVPGSQKERWEYQANLYRDMLEACLESKVCTSFATWGVSDSTSWITCEEKWCVKVPDADPLMFDKDFNPKPAYFAVRNVLLQYQKSH
ncbi:MAG: endo-1,4-beta-xylanase, partial [Candidatus Brocadia sp.]